MQALLLTEAQLLAIPSRARSWNQGMTVAKHDVCTCYLPPVKATDLKWNFF
jgi:hypothetical protein